MCTTVTSHMALDVDATRMTDILDEDAKLIRTSDKMADTLWEVIDQDTPPVSYTHLTLPTIPLV